MLVDSLPEGTMPARLVSPRPFRLFWSALVAVLPVLVAGCGDAVPPTATGGEAVAQLLSDASPSGSMGDAALSGEGPALAFAFGLPLGSGLPSDAGPLAVDLDPVVEVCADEDCLEPLAVFTRKGSGNSRVRVDSDNEHFLVHWTPSRSGARAGESYRIRVRLEERILGSAEVEVAAPGRQGAGRSAEGVTRVILAQAFAIRFAIAEGGDAPPSDPDIDSARVGEAGGTLRIPGTTLTILPGALGEAVVITMTRLPDPEAPELAFAPGTHVGFSPTGLSFATPASLVMTFDPALVPAGLGQEAVAIHRLNADGSTTALPTTVDLSTGTAVAFLDGFSQYLVVFTLPGNLTWVGGASPDPRSWQDPANWWPAVVPTAAYDVLIPSGTQHAPRITTPAEVRALRIFEGNSLELAGSGIVVGGTLFAEGPVTGTRGFVLMEGAGEQVARGTVGNLWIARGATRLSGALRVTGNLLVNGPGASLEIGSHALVVEGDLDTIGETARLLMDNLAGRVTVLGDARFMGGWEGDAPLQRGVLELHGNLVGGGSPSSLRATGNHLTLFAGQGTEQVVSLAEGGSRLANAETLNPGQVTFASNARLSTLSWGNAGVGGRVLVRPGLSLEVTTAFIRGILQADELRVGGDLASAGGVPYLVDRTVFTHSDTSLPYQTIPNLDFLDVVVEGSDVRIGEPWVRVRRSLLLNAGRLRIQGNVLEVNGGIRADASASGGVLRMEAGDRVLAWHVDLRTARAEFPGGTLWIQGDLVGRETMVGFGVGHRTVFHGSTTQDITGAGGFALGQLVLANTGDGVRIRTPNLQLSGPDADQRILELVGNTRMEYDGSAHVGVGIAVYRATSRTHFASPTDRAFNCVWAFTEPGYRITTEPGNSELGCARFGTNRDYKFPTLEDFTPPSRLEVTILEPGSGASYEEGDAITFRSSVTLGGAPVPATFTWFSSRGGNLGSGATLVRNDLTPGVHLVEVRVDATAPDGAMLQGSASVLLSVSSEDVPPPSPPVVTTVELSPVSDALALGEGGSFRARALDQFGLEMLGVTFTWATSSECIAPVSAGGTVTGRSPGTATITATADGVSGQATVVVGQVNPNLPTSLLGTWYVCRRNTGAFLYSLEVTEQTAAGQLTGQVFNSNGTTSFLSGTWSSPGFNMNWSRLVQGGERFFAINQGVALATDHMRGSYNDRIDLLTYDVDLRRGPR
ncbi:MAG: Ig-like domain-containing protein [Gemmatimonadales bacterium]|nr:MAG: Ig-like domain-containing protein [Gemmatimonadales bacterium]